MTKKWLIISLAVLVAVAIAGFLVGQKDKKEAESATPEPVTEQPTAEEQDEVQKGIEAQEHYDLVNSYTVTAKWGDMDPMLVTLIQTGMINALIANNIEGKEVVVEKWVLNEYDNYEVYIVVNKTNYMYLYSTNMEVPNDLILM